jgi:hypothetical protein
MTRFRILTAVALAFGLTVGTTGCAQVSEVLNPSDGAELVGTTWSGADSDGDEWAFEFQPDGGLTFSFNDGTYDDDTDTWAVDNGTITITIAFDAEVANLVGPYLRDATVLDLDGVQGDVTWSLTVEKN